MRIMTATGDRSAERLPVLVWLRNWLIGPPPGTVLPPKAEDEEAARIRREIESLTPEGLAIAVSNVLWAQRGSLKVNVSSNGHKYRGTHSPGERGFVVTMPEGISMSFNEKCQNFSVKTQDGESEQLDEQASTRLAKVWKAIQAITMCDALGVEVVQSQEGLRPSDVLKSLDDAVCAIVERADPPRSTEKFEYVDSNRHMTKTEWIKATSSWKDLGGGVHLSQDVPYESWYGEGPAPKWYRLMNTEMGVLRMRGENLLKALERRKRSSFANALGLARALPEHLPMPSGNAQAARVLRLCREAVAREPGLVDAKGTPIAPLVEQHLPRLMLKHAEAARIAETSELAAIDAELMQGIERVRLAVEEALVVSRVDKREALRTELAFLEYRHPSPNALSLDAPKEAA
jgi:hypothetical protein